MDFVEKIRIKKYLNGKFGILFIALISGFLTFITNRNSNYILQPSKYYYHHDRGSEALIQLEKKIQDPFKHQVYPPSSNFAKREFRLLVPLLAKLLGLNFYTIFIFSFLMNAIFIYFFALVLEKNKFDRASNLWLTLGFSFTFLGKCGFSDPMFGHFDVFAYTLILIAYISPNKIKLLLYFLAFWVDERVIISIFFQFLIDLNKFDKKIVLILKYSVVIILVAICRFLLFFKFNLFIPVGDHADVGLNVLYNNFENNFILGLFSSFEFGWLFIIHYCLESLKKKRGVSYIIVFSIFFATISSCLVGDISRSSSYLLPIFIYCILYFKGNTSDLVFEKLAYFYCLLNFLIGSYYYVYGTGLKSLVPNFYYIKKLISGFITFII